MVCFLEPFSLESRAPHKEFSYMPNTVLTFTASHDKSLQMKIKDRVNTAYMFSGCYGIGKSIMHRKRG